MTRSENVAKQINQVYYLVYTATILSTIIGYMLTMDSPASISPQSETGIALYSALIFYILVSVPGSLILFHQNTKKWKKLPDENLKLKKYQKGASLRLAAIGLGLVASVIIFFFMRNLEVIYCAGVAAIALLFCKPNAAKIESELDLDEQ